MGELYKEYKSKYNERNEERKRRGEAVVNGEPCDKKEAENFLKELAWAVGVYKEFTSADIFKEIISEIPTLNECIQEEKKEECIKKVTSIIQFYKEFTSNMPEEILPEIPIFDESTEQEKEMKEKSKIGNPNWHHYQFTESEKDNFIRLLDYKEYEDIKKCRGFGKNNLEANPEVRKMIERIFVDYVRNHASYYNNGRLYNCFERNLWTFGENIYPIDGIVNEFLESVASQRRSVKDLLPEIWKKIIVEYDKGIYYLVMESLNMIEELVSEFTENFQEEFKNICDMIKEEDADVNKENDANKEEIILYEELINYGLNLEELKKERELAKKLKETKYRLKDNSREINEYRKAQIELRKKMLLPVLIYQEHTKQHSEAKIVNIDMEYMFAGRAIKYRSMNRLLELLEKKEISFEKYMIETMKNRIQEEEEESYDCFQNHIVLSKEQ